VPVLLVHGQQDRYIPIERAPRCARRIRLGHAREVPEAGHVTAATLRPENTNVASGLVRDRMTATRAERVQSL